MKKNKILDIQKLKHLNTAFATLTAYDFPSAKIINQLNIPLVLVGDSASMVVYGYQDTTPIQMDEMLLIAKAVERGIDKALLVGDMPFMSYQPSIELAIKNAGRFIKEGHMDAIKLEGGIEYVEQISAIITAGIPVMGHIGLKPQSVLIESGYKVQGKTSAAALKIYQDALVLEKAGVFALVLESVPEELAQIITQKIKIPTIGIGAGKFCDGQIQVLHDIVGLLGTNVPKHANVYINTQDMMMGGIQQYQSEVENNNFPNNNNSTKMDEKELTDLKNKIENL
jgi:3-methyl-2-oxobutanoate hydroxymethyltransferase